MDLQGALYLGYRFCALVGENTNASVVGNQSAATATTTGSVPMGPTSVVPFTGAAEPFLLGFAGGNWVLWGVVMSVAVIVFV